MYHRKKLSCHSFTIETQKYRNDCKSCNNSSEKEWAKNDGDKRHPYLRDDENDKRISDPNFNLTRKIRSKRVTLLCYKLFEKAIG